jgi:peptidoglycan/LPS O-acetylase OafA/YrhL
MNSRWLYVTLALAAVLATLHLYGIAHHTYWHYRWYDTPMHLIGGAMVGALLLTFVARPGPTTYLAGILAVAIAWEIFEFHFKISTGQIDYWYDTFHDIANGCMGGMFLYLFSEKNIWRSV